MSNIKDIRNYLPFYIGCECMMTKNSYHAVHELGLSADRTFKLTGRLSDYFSEPTTKAECKLLLRPLSDMKEEEKEEIGFEAFHMLRSDLGDRSLPARNLSCMWAARQTAYLLSRHFDLFGLIPAGLAIDKTKKE